MAAKILYGKPIADRIHNETARRVAALRSKGIRPALRFIRVGNDPASCAYVAMKEKKATELGIDSHTTVLPETISQQELLRLIDTFNKDDSVHGILVQAPLPQHICEQEVFAAVDPRKDVDGFHPENMGRLLLGDPDGFRPCTPAGIIELLRSYDISWNGADVVILGRGNIVGKPLAAILCQKTAEANATVTLVHTGTRNIKEHCQRADILVAAMGKAKMITADFVKNGAVVVDVGVNRIADATSSRGYQLVGDVDFAQVSEIAAAITPNPGGVGPMTVAMLLANTVKASEFFHSSR